MGSALKIKPILTVESEITPIERVRTSRRAFERMVELLRSRAKDGDDAWMVQHIQAPAEAQELAARGKEIFGVPPRVISDTPGHLRDRTRDSHPGGTEAARRRRAAELAAGLRSVGAVPA